VLDELGSQKPTQFIQDVLYYVINSRYNTQRATIFTTNYFDEGKDGTRLVDRVGDPMRSRLHEMTELISMRSVPDHRIANKQSGNTI
jgi:DNA replication protein DnaC